MKTYQLTITEDQALILGAFLHRWDKEEKLEFQDCAEYLAFVNLAGEVERTTGKFFARDYFDQLAQAKKRISSGYEGDYPGPHAGA